MTASDGIWATVNADELQDMNSPGMMLSVGAGGIPGTFVAGNLSSAAIAGDVGTFDILTLEGAFDPPNIRGTLVVNKENSQSLIHVGFANAIVFAGNSPGKMGQLHADGTIKQLTIDNKLSVVATPDGGQDGNIQAMSIGNLTGSGSLSANNIIASEGIGKIDLKGDLAGGIKTPDGDIKLINVGGNLTSGVQIGNSSGTPITVAGNFVGYVTVGKGPSGPITVHGNFTLPGGNVTSLVRTTGGDIQTINVDGDIGGSPTQKVAGKIEGKSIATITSGKSIFLQTIHSTNGGIKPISATNGVLTAAVEAEGGNIDEVNAKKVAGNLTARVTDGTSALQGSIWQVRSTDAIPDNVTIKADSYISQIIVANPDAVVEKFKVHAQEGGFGSTLIINVGKGTFLGTVHLAPNKYGAPNFKDGDILFSLYQNNNQRTDWTVKKDPNAPAGITTTIDALFTKLATGKFGLDRRVLKLSDADFTIDGP